MEFGSHPKTSEKEMKVDHLFYTESQRKLLGFAALKAYYPISGKNKAVAGPKALTLNYETIQRSKLNKYSWHV